MGASPIISGKFRYILSTEVLNITLSSQKLVGTSSGKYAYFAQRSVFDVDPNWAIGYTIRTSYFVSHCFS